ncbi:Rrf2 family transcriptional regulator [Synechococcus lacustris]|uniref:RrF2 family transcriptional regulator n=1 Tax=Synechococcus lacustris TaxID=2116544 RepID=UPI00333F3B28
MGFNAKTEYGLVALLELVAVFPSSGILQVSQIASQQNIPDRYLEQMMISLRKAGILRSIRGPRGGYQLNRSPSEIALAEVINCLEGDTISPNSPTSNTPEYMAVAGLQASLDRIRKEFLESMTLQQLADQRDQYLEFRSMYFI